MSLGNEPGQLGRLISRKAARQESAHSSALRSMTLTMPRLTKLDWLLVADGSRAAVFRNEGPPHAPKLVVEKVYAIDNPPSHLQGSDKPGRINDFFGNKSAMESTDWHQVAEDRFIERIAADLEQDRKAGRFRNLMIAAPPEALGVLRVAITRAVHDTVVAEFNKDWTKLPLPELETAVVTALGK